jgi:hypothetical protein
MNRNFTTISTIAVVFLLTFFEYSSLAQDAPVQEKPIKSYKSYNSFKAPLIEDNSFLVEEAFNQSTGVIQFISTCYFSNIRSRDLAYSFTQEIPLQDVKHQISYTINYIALNAQAPGLQGLGDFMVNYRYELKGKDDWALIVPTGDFRKGFGTGAWGGQFNLPLTKLVSNRLVFHYNTGFTLLKHAQFALSDATSEDEIKRRHLTGINLGASIIWMPADKLNLMFEYVSNINDSFNETGQVSKGHQFILNPGLRYAFDIGKCQIVPGVSIPVAVEKNTRQPGAFIYLSIEPNYNN